MPCAGSRIRFDSSGKTPARYYHRRISPLAFLFVLAVGLGAATISCSVRASSSISRLRALSGLGRPDEAGVVPVGGRRGVCWGGFRAPERAAWLGRCIGEGVTCERFGALLPAVSIQGLIPGCALKAGAFTAKRFLLH